MRAFRSILALAIIVAIPAIGSADLVVGDALADVLAVADPVTGELTDYAAVGTPHIVSLAYDANTGMAYCSDTSEGVNQILQIDPQTGSCTMVVQVPDMFIVFHSLAIDPATGILYGIDQEHGELYWIDVDEGTLNLIGSIGVYWITGADFDPVSGDLYVCIGGLDDSGALYTVDTETAAATLVASTHRLMGLAFDPEGVLYGVNNYWYPNDPGFYRIDKATGDWEELGSYPGRNLMSIEAMDVDVVRVIQRSLSDVKELFE